MKCDKVLCYFKYLSVLWIHDEANLELSAEGIIMFTRFIVSVLEVNSSTGVIIIANVHYLWRKWCTPTKQRTITSPMIFILNLLAIPHINRIIYLAKYEQVTKYIEANSLWLVQLNWVLLDKCLYLNQIEEAEEPLENWWWLSWHLTWEKKWNNIVKWILRIVHHFMD